MLLQLDYPQYLAWVKFCNSLVSPVKMLSFYCQTTSKISAAYQLQILAPGRLALTLRAMAVVQLCPTKHPASLLILFRVPGACPFSRQKHKRPSQSCKHPCSPCSCMTSALFCWPKHKAKPNLRGLPIQAQRTMTQSAQVLQDSFEGWKEITKFVVKHFPHFKNIL